MQIYSPIPQWSEKKKCLYSARSLGQPTRLNILKHIYLTIKRKGWLNAEVDYAYSRARGFDAVLLQKSSSLPRTIKIMPFQDY